MYLFDLLHTMPMLNCFSYLYFFFVLAIFRDGLCLYLPLAKKKLLKETSIYTTRLKIRELRESGG